MIHISKIDGFLSINEQITSRVKIPHDIFKINKPCEILITDRRLIVYDSKWNKKYFAEAVLSKISSIQIHAKDRIIYLIAACILIIIGLIFKVYSAQLIFEPIKYDAYNNLYFVMFATASAFIMAYVLTRSSSIFIYVAQAEPITIEHIGSAADPIIQHLIKNIDAQRAQYKPKNEPILNKEPPNMNDGQYRLHK